MSEQDGFDPRLAALFEAEHRQVVDDAFVASTLRKVREGRRRRDFFRIAARATALAAVVVASPWLIAAVEQLNAAVGSSLSWTRGLPGTLILGALATVAVVARLRRR